MPTAAPPESPSLPAVLEYLDFGWSIIPLTQGRFAIVDPADHAELSRYRWYYSARKDTGYARRHAMQGGRKIKVYMHQQVMCAPHGVHVDHRDGNGLNNTRGNLRIATVRQNLANQRVQGREKASRYKGVTKIRRTGKWMAQIKVNGEHRYLGTFWDEADAAQTYDAAAAEAFGEFARLNTPEVPSARVD